MTVTTRWRDLRCLVPLMGLALVACGGGGGGGGGGGSPADTTAPRVRLITPADGGSRLEPTQPVTASFDEALDCASVVADSFTLSEGSTAIAGTVSCSGDTIGFTPTAALPTRATLTATIGTAVTDAAGNALASAYRWSFATRPWTLRLGTAAIDTGAAVAVDTAGSMFVVGGTFGSPDGSTNAGGSDALASKYDRDNRLLWTRLIGLGDDDQAQAVTSDGSGGAFVAGSVSAAPGSRRGLLARFDANGNQTWSVSLGVTDTLIRSLHVDVNGDVLVAGGTFGILFDPTASSGPGAFVAKYSADGTLRWGQQFGATSAGGVATDAGGNVVVAGYHFSAVDGNVALGGSDMVVVKFDSDGNRLWTRQLGTAADDVASTVAVDANGRIYAGGRSAGVMAGSANAGQLDAVLVHLDSDGSTRWIRQFGSAADDYIWSVAVDATGRAVVAGWAGGSLPGQTHQGGVDAFTGVYAANGSLAWLRQWGTTADDYAYGTTVTAGGDVVSTGNTSGSLDGFANLGESDVIVVKYAADGTSR